MSGFADLVKKANPALRRVNIARKEATDWEIEFVNVVDDEGDPINLTGATGVCELVDTVGGTPFLTLTFTGAADGSYTLTKDNADTVDLTDGTNPRRARWSLTVTNAGVVVAFFEASSSLFTIVPE